MPKQHDATDPVIEMHRWYPLRVIARLLNVSADSLRKRCKCGTLPAAQMSSPGGQGPWRMKGEDVLQLLGKMELARGGSGAVAQRVPQESPIDILKKLEQRFKEKR